MVLSEEQYWNAQALITFKLDGKIIFTRLKQLPNAAVPILSIPSDRFTVMSLLQFEKIPVEIFVILFDRVARTSSPQWLKAYDPICVTEFGITTDSRSHDWNA